MFYIEKPLIFKEIGGFFLKKCVKNTCILLYIVVLFQSLCVSRRESGGPLPDVNGKNVFI